MSHFCHSRVLKEHVTTAGDKEIEQEEEVRPLVQAWVKLLPVLCL